MSAALHDRFTIDDWVQVSAPFGEVVLQPSDRPLVLASAGVGVTPHAGMLSHLARTRPTAVGGAGNRRGFRRPTGVTCEPCPATNR